MSSQVSACYEIKLSGRYTRGFACVLFLNRGRPSHLEWGVLVWWELPAWITDGMIMGWNTLLDTWKGEPRLKSIKIPTLYTERDEFVHGSLRTDVPSKAPNRLTFTSADAEGTVRFSDTRSRMRATTKHWKACVTNMPDLLPLFIHRPVGLRVHIGPSSMCDGHVTGQVASFVPSTHLVHFTDPLAGLTATPKRV